MSLDAEYGSGAILKLRDNFGYISGNLLDHGSWNIASFGWPFIFTLLSALVWFKNRRNTPSPRTLFLAFFGIFGLVSYMIPQLFYFDHGAGVEEQTEISKFFFCTHLSLAITSVLGIDYIVPDRKLIT